MIKKAKPDRFNELYMRLGTRKRETIFWLAKVRECRSSDTDHVRCMKDEKEQVLTKRKVEGEL